MARDSRVALLSKTATSYGMRKKRDYLKPMRDKRASISGMSNEIDVRRSLLDSFSIYVFIPHLYISTVPFERPQAMHTSSADT